MSAQQSRLSTAQSGLSASQAARSGYKTNYETVASLGKAVPADDDVPSLVYELARTSDSSKVDFRSIKLAGGGSSTPPPPSTNSGSANSGKSGGGQSALNSQPASKQSTGATQGASAGLPPGSAVGPAGFPTMPFTFQFEGSFFHLGGFFSKLERYVVVNPSGVDVTGRLLQIDGISLNAAASGFPHMTASVAATAYLLPATQGLTNGASPGSPPASGGSQPVNSTGATPPTTPATATGPVK